MENQELVAKEAYSKMARLCSRSEQCSADIRKKIIAYELVDEIVEEILEKLKTEKFLNDERYVKAYVADKFKLNKWGKVKIRHSLRMKGLPEDLIQNQLAEIDPEKYRKLLIKTMKDKAKAVRKHDRFEKMGQIIRFAQTRGFEPEMIHRHLKEVLE